MLLAIDIGNTNILIGIFENNNLLNTKRISTDFHKTSDEYYVIFETLLKDYFKKIQKVVVASVVPDLNDIIEKSLQRAQISKIHFLIINDFEAHLKINVKNKFEVGMDRLANALGAYLQFKKDILVIDFGTATTIDVILDGPEYVGGIIMPGILTSLDSLYKKARKLFPVEIKKGKNVIGKSTIECIQSGIYYGNLFSIEGLIEKIKTETNKNFLTIGTGGLINLYAGEKIFDVIDNFFTIKSLNLVNNLIG